MKKQIIIETERLYLRHWLDTDLEAFIQMNADPEVMRYFPDTLSPERTKAFYDRIQQEFSECGYGLYAAEEKESSQFIGFIGFHSANMDVDFCPCVEIGWRLDKPFWNKGYATEGAGACLKYGFQELNFDKVYSFTSIHNLASQKVMQKIGLELERHFDHPNIEDGHMLKAHVCYWREKNG